MRHRPEHPARSAPGQPVELRVHGVGGASPEELLDVPVVERVAGDPAAGFFRPWFEPDPPGWAREGYSWGGLTSASRLRALWVLLSPFALANLAGWMVHHGGDPTDESERARSPLESATIALVRMFGLVVTVAVAGYVAVGAIDLVAYQCGTRPTCPQGRWWLSPWENRLVEGHAGRVLVVGAAAAALVVLGIAWLARLSQEAIHDSSRVDYAGRGDPAFRLNLKQRRLWTSPHVAHRLGLVHTAAALATIGLTLAAVGGALGASRLVPMTVAGWAVLAASAVALVRLRGVPAAGHVALAGLAAVHLVVTMMLAWSAGDVSLRPGPAPGGRVIPALLLPVYPAFALAAGGAAVALWRRHRESTLRVALVAPALLLLAAGIVNAFGSGFLIRLADLLGTPVSASGYPVDGALAQPPIVYADAVADAAVMTVVTILVLAVAVGVVWLRAGAGPGCRTLAERYAAHGGLDCSDAGDRAWARRVGKAEAVATLTDKVALVIAVVLAVAVGVAAGANVFADDGAGLGLGPWADAVAGPASVVLGLVPLAAVYGISRLYRSPAARRVVGIVWDVATFWPRWFHPWSPPSYGERAVPQLTDRLAVLTGSGGVVVSAHSQGSVLALAALLQSDPSVLDGVAVLTHGSPLTRLYARFFPEYVSVSLLGEVAGRVRGWVNLWRATDYIGGPLAAAGVDDRRLLDPPTTRAPARGERRPRPARHGAYDRTEAYADALSDLMPAGA